MMQCKCGKEAKHVHLVNGQKHSMCPECHAVLRYLTDPAAPSFSVEFVITNEGFEGSLARFLEEEPHLPEASSIASKATERRVSEDDLNEPSQFFRHPGEVEERELEIFRTPPTGVS